MIASGFPSLDKLTHGFEKRKLYVIADKEPLLNSVIGKNLAYNMAIEDHHAMLYFSMSYNNTEKVTQLLSIKSEISKDQIKEGQLEHSQWKDPENGIMFIYDSCLYLDDSLPFNVEEVCKKIKTTNDKTKLEIVIIDGFSVDNPNSRTEVIHALKTLAVELQIPIVLITKYEQRTFKFAQQSLQWKKATLGCVDCLMFIQPPLKGSLASIMNIPVWAFHSPVCVPHNLYEINVVKNEGYKCGTVLLSIDYATNKLMDNFSTT